MRLLTGDELGWRLAGLTDGEGCFYIAQHRRNHFARHVRKPTMHCGFALMLRSDDRPLLELLQRSTGLGRLYDVQPSALTLERRPGAKPTTYWKVERIAETVRLVEFFDRYPPISKKGRDYAIWREGVQAWARRDRGRVAELRLALMAVRTYLPPEVEPPELVPDNQLRLLDEVPA